MSKTTCIRKAAWVAAWDVATERHVYLRDVDVVFSDNMIRFVGKSYEGHIDENIDGKNLFVMPGLVNIHSHPSTEPGYKGIREEHGVPEMYMSGLYERVTAFQLDEEGRRAAAEVAYSEMLASGVTSVADLSNNFNGWIDLLARSGLRGFIAPRYASSQWYLENNYQLKFRLDEHAGRKGFEEALKIIAEAEKHPSGRLSGILYPAQIDTCSEDLLRNSIEVAHKNNWALTVHVAQSVNEFNVMVQRHGKTPIQWADEIGLLGSNTIIGHAVFIDEHSWLHWWSKKDLHLLAESGASVAHCPTPFARYGQTLENLGRYIRVGVNVGIGTDTFPHNILEEMRWAAVLARIAGEDLNAVTTAEVFHAATVGGAKALMSNDIGRLAPGMKADLVLVDLSNSEMMPVRDPLRSLIYTAADRAVRDVYVDGVKVVADRRVLTLDKSGAASRLQDAQRRMIEAVPSRDYAGRTAEEIVPFSLPLG